MNKKYVVVALIVLVLGVGWFLLKNGATPEQREILQAENEGDSQSLAPAIISVAPSSVKWTWGNDPGTEITLTGSGFKYSGLKDSKPHIFLYISNTRSGEIAIAAQNAPHQPNWERALLSINADGTQITTVIPAFVRTDAGKEMNIAPGNYKLKIAVDGAGVSNEVPITVGAI